MNQFPHENKIDEKVLIIILFLIQFTHILDFVIMMPLGPTFMRSFEIGPDKFSMVVSSYTFAAAIAGIVGTFFLDKYDRKTSLLFLYAGFSIGTLLCAMAPNFYSLVLARVVAGGFGGILGAIIFSIIGDVIPENRRGKATGTVMAAFSVASVLGIPVGLFLADTFNWHAPFLFIVLIGFFVFYLILTKFPKLTSHMHASNQKRFYLEEIKTILKFKNHQRALFLSIAIMLSGFLVIPFVSPYMVKNVGLQEKQLAYIYFFGGIFTFITSRLIGIFSDKYGKFKTFSVVAPLSIIPILIVTHLSRVPVAFAIASTSLFFILVSGRFVPVMALVTSSTSKLHRGSFMSFNSSIQMVATGLASLIAGQIISENKLGELVHYNVVGYLAAFLTLVAVFLASKVEIIKD